MSLYRISKNSHYSNLIPQVPYVPTPPGVHNGATNLFGEIKFKSNCKYIFPNDSVCKTDINKAIGIGYGLMPNAHHNWSTRLGWRVKNNKYLILFNYCYVNSQRISEKLGDDLSFKFDVFYPFSIVVDTVQKRVIMTIGEYESIIEGFTKVPTMGYILKPYFGGNCVAPHDMDIEINYATF